MVVKRGEQRLKTPARAVAEKQDPSYRQADFLRDLERVSERRPEVAQHPASLQRGRRPS